MSNKYFGTLFLMILTIGSSLFAQNSLNGISHAMSITNNLTSPLRMAIDKHDVIFVTDVTTKTIKKFTVSGNFLGLIPFQGSPLSLAANSIDQIFVGDGETGFIYKIESDGTSTIFYTSCQFPSSMAFGADANLYISDSKLQEVHVVSPSGNLVRTIGNGNLIYPTGIEFDATNNRILVAEHGGIGDGSNLHAEVKIFDTQGNYISSIGSYGNGDGKFYRIQGIALNRCGNLFVIDPYQGEISLFSENGMYLSKFGQFGNHPGQLNLPMDIVFDSQDHAIVTSLNNGTLEVYDIQQALPTSNISLGAASICAGESIDVPVTFTGTAPWTFTYTKNGSNPSTVANTSQNPYIIHTTESGEYRVISLSDATTSGTCLSGSANIILSPVPQSSFTSHVTNLDVAFENTSLNETSAFWDFGDGYTSTDLQPSHIYASSGSYTVTLTTNNPCGNSTTTETLNLYMVQADILNLDNSIIFFPNPVKDILTIQFNTKQNRNCIIEITNMTGQTVFSKSTSTQNQINQINLNSLERGVYTLKIASGDYKKMGKLILIN